MKETEVKLKTGETKTTEEYTEAETKYQMSRGVIHSVIWGGVIVSVFALVCAMVWIKNCGC